MLSIVSALVLNLPPNLAYHWEALVIANLAVAFLRRNLSGVTMKPQQNKLLSLFLLLLFLCHSTLQASSCPCCTFQSILQTARVEAQVASKPCCRNKATASSPTQPTCCNALAHSNETCSLDEKSYPCESPSDCACCIQLPSYPTASHASEKSTTAVNYVYVELPFVFTSLNETASAVPEVSPPPLIRRLAMLSFWRN